MSMLQTGTVPMGGWYDRMEPDRQGFVDGSGSILDLEQAIAFGVASRHEKLQLLGRHIDLKQFWVGFS